MKELKDTTQVLLANSGAWGVSLVTVNEILTFISLLLAIIFTLYKLFYKITED
jgi:hypothetical protein